LSPANRDKPSAAEVTISAAAFDELRLALAAAGVAPAQDGDRAIRLPGLTITQGAEGWSEDELRDLIDESAALARKAAFAHASRFHPPWSDLPEHHKPYWREIAAPVIDYVIDWTRKRSGAE
jgi:hypothetical protein